MNTKVLGKNIVYLRKKNDITQLILAEKIGISRKQLHNYERALLNYICLFNYLFISSQMSAKPYFIGSTGILLLW